MSSKESINWIKPSNLRESVYISGPADIVCGNSLRMWRESFSSKIVSAHGQQ